MNQRQHENGGALVLVLALLATAGVLVAAITVLSRIHRDEVAAHVQRGHSRYIAEGALNRIVWLIEADRSVYPNDSAGSVDYADYSIDRYMADGIEHEMDYYGTPVRFTLTDASSGLDLAASSQTALDDLATGRTDQSYITDALRIFGNRLTDYKDSDDTIGEDGMEESDYEALELDPLPRNGAMEYREEILWIPDARRFAPVDRFGRLTSVRTVKASAAASDSTQNQPGPPGSQSSASLPNLFTANYTLLWTYGGLEKEQAAQVLTALEVWRRERTSLEDQLDSDLYNSLTQKFSMTESGAYTVTVTRAAPEGDATGRLSASFEAAGIAGPTSGTLEYWGWMRF